MRSDKPSERSSVNLMKSDLKYKISLAISALRYRPGVIAKASLSTMIVLGVRAACQILLLVMLARFLGPRYFGEFSASIALSMLLGTLSSFGTGYLVLREAAKTGGRIQMAIFQAIPLTIIVSLMLTPAFIWLAMVPLSLTNNLFALVLIGASEIIVMPVVMLIAQHQQGSGKVELGQIVLTAPLLLRLLIVTVVLQTSYIGSLDQYAVIHLFSILVTLIVSLVLLNKEIAATPKYSLPDKTTIRTAFPFAVMRFTSVGPAEVDKILMLRMFSAIDAGNYAIAARAVAFVGLPVSALLLASQPTLFRKLASPNREGWRLVWILIGLSLIIGIIIMLLLSQVLVPLIYIVFGLTYKAAEEYVALLSWAVPLMALRIMLSGIMIPLTLPAMRTGIECLGILTIIVTAVISAGYLGVHGIILAVIVGELLMAVAFLIAILLNWKKSYNLGRRI